MRQAVRYIGCTTIPCRFGESHSITQISQISASQLGMSRLFENPKSVIKHRLGLVTASISRGDPVLITNYHSLSANIDEGKLYTQSLYENTERERGYKVVSPQDREPIHVWQA